MVHMLSILIGIIVTITASYYYNPNTGVYDPDPTTPNRHLSLDGTLGLYGRWWRPTFFSTVVVLQHDVGEHIGRLERLAQTMSANGYAVFAADWRGHGRSQGRRAYIERHGFSKWVDDLESSVQLVMERESNKKIVVLGIGVGGVAALRFVLDRRIDGLSGLILAAPCLSLGSTPPVLMSYAGWAASFVFPFIKLDPVEPELLSDESDVVADFKNDPLVYHDGLRIGMATEVAAAVSYVHTKFKQVTLPLLIMHGNADRMCSEDGSIQLNSASLSKSKKLKITPNGSHAIFHDRFRDEVVNDVLDFLKVITTRSNL